MEPSRVESYIASCFSNNKDYEQISNIQFHLPKESIKRYKEDNKGKIRNRVFSIETTLLGMLLQAGHEDKSMQNTVLMLSKSHNDRKELIEKDRNKIQLTELAELEKQKARGLKKPGRPKKHFLRVQKSKEKEISNYPSSYDEATKRFTLDLMRGVFEETAEWNRNESNKKQLFWIGREVFVIDGTTFKTQDTKVLREYFECDREKNNQPLPVGKLEGVINLYRGGIVAVEIDKYTSSEGKMFKKLFNRIPNGSLVLADDLYSKYGYFSLCKTRNIDMIVQSKRKNKETVVRKISENDTIVKWERGSNRKSVLYNEPKEMETEIELRKIDIIDPQNPARIMTIYTTLLDEQRYPAVDIISLYFKRWEIEISFRQIKSILKMEYLRGKSVDMVKKEIYAHLILYNIIRKMIREETPTEDGDFPPYSSQVQTSTTMVKGAYVDKLGRSYHIWNAGRPKKTIEQK